MLRFYAAIIFIMAWVCASSCRASIVNVTLAGLPVDMGLASFTDLGSGTSFSNPIDGNNDFIVDHWNSYSGLADMTPGLVVSGVGYAGNGTPSLPFGFGFTMNLVQSTDEVSATMAYSTLPLQDGVFMPGSVLIQGFDDNNLVASDSVLFDQYNSFVEQPLSLAASSYDINSVTISATNLFDAFGQISYAVPEPPAAVLLIGFVVMGFFRGQFRLASRRAEMI